MIMFDNANGKLTEQQNNLYNMSVLWILGREWLIANGFYSSSKNWDLATQEITKSILAGATGPTDSQQSALQWSIGDAGFQYLLMVYQSLANDEGRYPPGFDQSKVAIDWRMFACFASWLADTYVANSKGSGVPLENVLKDDWSGYSCGGTQGNKTSTDPVYKSVSPATTPPSATPPAVTPPIPTGINPTTNTPPATPPPTGVNWWTKWKTTIGVTAAGAAVIGGIMYFGRTKPTRKGK
jgi:hypothetical protein